MTSLFPYQAHGAKWLAVNERAGLFDDPGLGKTAQAVTACGLVGAKTIAVVCPASLVGNWRNEFIKFSETPVNSLDLNVVSYDRASRGALEHLSKIDVLICDEAHYLKERGSLRTKKVFGERCKGDGLIGRATHAWMLTGTPTPNSPYELWPMLRACVPDRILGKNGKPMAFWDFTERYCKVVESRFGAQIGPGRNLDELRERIAPFVLRRRKSEVLKDLPPVIFDVLTLTKGDAEKALARAEKTYEAELLRDTLESEGIAGLAKLAPHVASLRRTTGLAKVPVTIEWATDFLAGEDKLVIFAHHKEVIDQLFAGLKAFDPVRITGSTTPPHRENAVTRFQNDPECRVFIGQIQAAGTGLTLTAASDLVFVESSWVPAENEQAAMRIHRIGQRNACRVRFATLRGSLDETIARAVARKMSDIASIFG